MSESPLIFGEVLFDHFPSGELILGGAPFNVAWHLQGFGVHPDFFSRTGSDSQGTEIQTTMRKWGMRVEGLQCDPKHPTGFVKVSLKNGQPHYEIPLNQAWDNTVFPDHLPSGAPLLYHGTLALRHKTAMSTWMNIRQRVQGPVFLDVNLRAPWWDQHRIKILLEQTDWLKLNNEELDLIVEGQGDIFKKMELLWSRYPISTIVVTQGEKGAVAASRDGAYFPIKPLSSLKIVDTVGAGDAFSSVLILGILKNWDLETSMARAQSFASHIVQQKGATARNTHLYNKLMKKWDIK